MELCEEVGGGKGVVVKREGRKKGAMLFLVENR